MIRRVFYVLTFIASFSYPSFGSHMIGGDITYKCKGSNTFELTITLYQDCLNGIPQVILEDNPAFYSIFENSPGHPLVYADSIPALSSQLVDPNFSNACITNYPQTCMRKQVFVTDVTLPPSTYGYFIVYERCCRNAQINNIVQPGNTGVAYFATIPPFTAGQCPNNSAIFKNFPPQIICANNPFVYDFSATDADGDSLSYHLCSAHTGGANDQPKPYGNEMSYQPAPVTYLGGYSAEQPVSGLPPMQINPVTGVMTGTPNRAGRFVVTVCVDEWRNGHIINTLSRDIQFVITNCSKTVVADIPELPDEPNTFSIQCKGYTVKFINHSTGGFSYKWTFGVNNATSSDFEPTFTYPDTGTYRVTLVVNEGSTCQDSISRLVKIYPDFNADFSWAGKLCPGEPIQFNDRSVATYPPVILWSWSFGDGSNDVVPNPVHAYSAPGGPKQVTLIAKTKLGCRDTVTKTLPLPLFDPNAGNDTIIVKGYPYTLHGTGSEFYHWEPADYLSDPNISDPAANFPDTGTYTYVLFGSTKEGCTATDTIHIQVVAYGNIFVPNAFSPNGDGVNDELIPRIVGYSRINYFYIFNRFGQKIFSSSSENVPSWNGTQNNKPAEVGTYYYIINLTAANGQNVTKKGDITLIR